MINLPTKLFVKERKVTFFSLNTISSHIQVQVPPKVAPLSMYLENELELWKTSKHVLKEFEGVLGGLGSLGVQIKNFHLKDRS